MRSFDIELVNEGIEAVLLLQAVPAWRAGRLFLEGEMHALVAAVLLRMAGLDAFDRDAKAQPPDREFREVEQGIGAGEGHAIVRANGLRQAAFVEQLFEGRKCEVFAGEPSASHRSRKREA